MLVIVQWEKFWDKEQRKFSELYTMPAKKEMLAMVFGCEIFRPYILVSHVIIHTFHAAIKYLMEKKDAKSKLIRWILLFQEFDMEIKDKKGSDNVIATPQIIP